MSTNTKHTPGPWFYRESEKLVWTKQDHCAEGLLNNLHIAHICKQAGETKANARIIAAAPELLEALRVMLGLATAFGAAQKGDEWQEVLQARAAIAKATGQTA